MHPQVLAQRNGIALERMRTAVLAMAEIFDLDAPVFRARANVDAAVIQLLERENVAQFLEEVVEVARQTTAPILPPPPPTVAELAELGQLRGKVGELAEALEAMEVERDNAVAQGMELTGRIERERIADLERLESLVPRGDVIAPEDVAAAIESGTTFPPLTGRIIGEAIDEQRTEVPGDTLTAPEGAPPFTTEASEPLTPPDLPPTPAELPGGLPAPVMTDIDPPDGPPPTPRKRGGS